MSAILSEQRMARRSVSKGQARNVQKARYRELIQLVLEVCQTKGWDADLRTDDKKNHQLATIAVSRFVGYEEVTGLINITLHESVQYAIEKTSFHGYGLSDLLNAITVRLEELDWLEKKRDKQADRPAQDSPILKNPLKNFDKVARQLTRRHAGREPFVLKDEYDVQDLLHALLRAFYEDVRPEEYVSSYAGSSTRMDFLLKDAGVVVEAKHATAKLKEKEIGEELIIDIKKYQKHPDCRFLYCLVYDPNSNIRNPAGLERDLSGKHEKVEVLVVVVPQ